MHLESYFAACSVGVAPVRKEPAHRAEQVTQLLYGEAAEVLKNLENGWVQIRQKWDGYEGYVLQAQLEVITKRRFQKDAATIASQPGTEIRWNDMTMWLPAGAELDRIPQLDDAKPRHYGKKQKHKEDEPATREMIARNGRNFLNCPYAWGGRTHAGIDCSGLSQMAYKLANVSLPRDASQQATMGTQLPFLQEAATGDLAFFDNEFGHINHVGILLSPDTILHATETAGRVVIDKLDNAGIISLQHKRRTHQLRMVNRYVRIKN